MRKTADTRGRSYWDLFELLPGQVNVGFTKPLEKRGFHLHKNKVDHWFLVRGRIKVVLYDEEGNGWDEFFMVEGDLITIPTNVWHAYQNVGKSESCLLYYETNKSGSKRDDDFEMPLEKYDRWMK